MCVCARWLQPATCPARVQLNTLFTGRNHPVSHTSHRTLWSTATARAAPRRSSGRPLAATQNARYEHESDGGQIRTNSPSPSPSPSSSKHALTGNRVRGLVNLSGPLIYRLFYNKAHTPHTSTQRVSTLSGSLSLEINLVCQKCAADKSPGATRWTVLDNE